MTEVGNTDQQRREIPIKASMALLTATFMFWPEVEREGWLCWALLKYIDEAPTELYVQLKNAG